MHLKPHFVYENKTIFIYFLTISGILHLIFIFSTSSISHFLKPELNFNDNGTKKSNYVVEIDLESEELEEEELIEEEELVAADVREERRQLFVDTSGKAVDEEPRAETNKIGEKGSIARDSFADEKNINDNPRLESESSFPGKVPEELATAVPRESGLSIDVSESASVEDVVEEDVETLVEEETKPGLSDTAKSEELTAKNEVEEQNKSEDVKSLDIEELDTQALSSQELEQAENIKDIVSDTLESDVVIRESEIIENSNADVVEEKTEEPTDQGEKYTETASIPKTIIKEIVEGRSESAASKPQNKQKTPERQLNNAPLDDDAPYFEDSISNAPMTGAPAYNVKKHEYAPYYKHIKDKIRLYWLLQYGTDASINQVTKGYKPIVVTFKVLPSGKIMNVKIADSAGNELLASKIRMSIQNTTLNKFPDYINEKHIDVKFSYFFF